MITIGDILICMASQDNPYNGSFSGPFRAAALHRLKDGTLPGSLRAWLAPAGGGARLITADDNIDWEGFRSEGRA